MIERRFRQVDVFSAEPYRGNPVAVVLDAQDLTSDEMQRFARWTNLSETTFALPPENPQADYRLRIFTPGEELPFAGHPTLGSAHAWLEAGGTPKAERVVQECGAGLVDIRRDADALSFAAPPLLRSGPLDEPLLDRVADVLGLRRDDVVDAAWVDNGPGWIGVLLAGADAVLEVRPKDSDLNIGVAGARPDGELEVRAFFQVDGRTLEDPVTGSLNASLAQWLLSTGRVSAPYTARQGQVLGRDGRVRISVEGGLEDGRVWTGGATVTCISGTVRL